MAKKTSIDIEANVSTQQAQAETRKLAEETRRLESAAKKAAEALTKLNQSAIGRKTARAAERYGADLHDSSFDDFERLTTNRAEAGKMRRAFRSAHGMPEESHTERALRQLRAGKDAPGLHGPFWEHPAFTKPASAVAGAASSAWGVAKGTLGVAAGAAGIGGIVSVISHAFSEYKSKIGDQETLFKRTGASWESLGQSIKELGNRVSVSTSEAGRLASSFQRLSGATDTGLIGRVGAAGSLARSLGMGPEAGVTALGRAEFMGFGGSEGRQRQFANLIGQTIADGNMLGSSEKVFEDILKHIQGVEENTGNLPSDIALAGFASLRAAMYNQNPAMKGGAGDSAIAKAQAFASGKGGLWNEAMLARAFDKELRGSYDQVVTFDYLKGANMFATADSVFRNGSQESILDGILRQLDLETEARMPNATAENKLRFKSSVMGMGGSPQLMEEFLKSYGAVKGDRGFGEWAKGKFDFYKTPGAMGGAVSLYQAQNDPERLKALARQYTEGEHVKTSQADKDRINAAMSDPGQLAVVLQDVIAKQGEAGNAAEDLRDEVAKLNNTLTEIIGPRMGDLATNLAKFSNKLVELFNRVFGGGDSNAPPPTNEFESWTRRFVSENSGPDGLFDWMDVINRFIEFPDRDEIFRDFTTPIGGTNEELLGRIKDKSFGPGAIWRGIKDSFRNNPDFYGPDSFLNIGARALRSIGRGMIGDANATMDIGQYDPSEGLQPKGKGKTAQFYRDLLPYAMEASRKTGIAPELIIAHSAQETGFGSTLYDYNYFNVTAGKSWTGKSRVRGDNDPDGKKIQQKFRVYDSPQDAFDDYVETIKNLFPNALGARDVAAFGAGLSSGKYGRWAGDKEYGAHIGDRLREMRLRAVSSGGIGENTSLPSNLITTGRHPGDVRDLDRLIAQHPEGWEAFLAATRLWPGKVRIHEAGRARKKGQHTNNHQGGHAMDYELELNGKWLPNFQSAASFRYYEQFAQDMAAWGEHHHPGFIKRFRAGSYFGPDSKGRNWGDEMHWDMNPIGAPNGLYGDVIYGAKENLRQLFRRNGKGDIAIGQGMGDPETYYRNRFGMEPLPADDPIASSLPITSTVGQGQSTPINATLTVHYANGTSQVVAKQPIAGNPATPGMRSQLAYGVP